MKSGFFIFAVILGLLSGVIVVAGGDADRSRDLFLRHKILSLEEILRRNKAHIDGRIIIDLDFEEKDGLFYYDIKMLGSNGRYKKIRINAKTGALLGRK